LKIIFVVRESPTAGNLETLNHMTRATNPNNLDCIHDTQRYHQ